MLLRRPPHKHGGGVRLRLLSSRNWLPFSFTVCCIELIGNKMLFTKVYSALLSSTAREFDVRDGNEN